MKSGDEKFISSLRSYCISTFTMISISEHTLIFAAVFFLNIELCICVCAQAEYEINGECCPMCSPGSRVYRHCTEFTSTTCLNCVGSTYTDEPNGLTNCISCTVCDAGQGLRVKTACTRTSDTVCEPLEGFYCTYPYRSSCTFAVEHTKCNPGQYVKQKGTALKDAACAVCVDGTYSNGSLQICKQHTKCEDLGLKEITPGTNSVDAECGNRSPVGLIVGILVLVMVTFVAVAVPLIFKRHKKDPARDAPPENMRLSENHEGDTSPPREDRMNTCALNHCGHVSSPVEDDCEKKELTTHWIRCNVNM